MARLVVGNAVYHEVDLGSFHENEVQSALEARAHLLYPGFLFVPFTMSVEGAGASKRPDFILIENDYRCCWIGEVELVSHSLYGHVIPQVRTFREGVYGVTHAAHAKQRNGLVDEGRLARLLATDQPGVLVMANRFEAAWHNALRPEGAELAVFEMFRRADRAEFIFRANGFAPEAPGTRLSWLETDHSIPRLVRVHTPSALAPSEGPMEIEFKGAVTDWWLQLYEDKGWLRPVYGNPLQQQVIYELIRGPEGRLRIQEVKGQQT